LEKKGSRKQMIGEMDGLTSWRKKEAGSRWSGGIFVYTKILEPTHESKGNQKRIEWCISSK